MNFSTQQGLQPGEGNLTQLKQEYSYRDSANIAHSDAILDLAILDPQHL